MNFSRALLVALVCSVLLHPAAWASEKESAASGVAEGTFYKVEQGDHLHFLIKDKHGKQQSFIVLQDSKALESYLHNPSALQGRSVRVHWRMEMIPEAGEKMKTLTKVEKRKPLDH